MATEYSKLKVVELKDLLKERGIHTTGLSRKQSIIDALEAQDAKVSDDVVPQSAQDAGATSNAGEQNGGDEDVGTGGAETGIEAEKVKAAVAEVGQVDAAGENAEEVVPDVTCEVTPTAPSLQPTVLEADEPVSSKPTSALATPQQPSSAPEDASSDSRKRKRRSPTPPMSEETVSKRLKAAEQKAGETVKQHEDAVIEDAMTEDAMIEDTPVPLGGSADMEAEGEKIVQPFGSSYDVRDLKEDMAMSDRPAPSEHSAAPDADTAAVKPRDGAIHPATRALYIRELIRPLQPQQLRDHLVSLAGTDSSESSIENFHLDVLRTHAFAVFATLEEATRVRSALHNTVFPSEPARKPLWVDFVPEEQTLDWIDKELSSSTSRRDAKRWEVVYDGSYSIVTLTHAEVTAPGPGRQPSFASQGGAGMPNAPLGPRGTQHPSQQAPLPLPTAASPRDAREVPAIPDPRFESPSDIVAKPATGSASFANLDRNFRSTTSKPKLYYLPKDKELADKRLDELDRETSRDWDGGRAVDFEGPLRRYTFEDGERLVDGGPDRGSFGVPLGGRGRGRGGYGGGGGRYRGR